MTRERRVWRQTQARGAPCTLRVRNDENDNGEARRRDVQAHERPIRPRKETGDMSMRRRATRIQGQEVEARLCDVSGR